VARLSEDVKEQVEKAAKAARKAVLHPRKKKRKESNFEDLGINPEDIEERPPIQKTQWVEDKWGEQGEVFFDGEYYWLTFLKPKGDGIWDVARRALTEKEWEEYKKKPLSPRLTLNRHELETLVTEKRLSSTPRKKKSTKHSKKRQSKKSPTKSGKTVTRRKRSGSR